jgi:transposase-like protein
MVGMSAEQVEQLAAEDGDDLERDPNANLIRAAYDLHVQGESVRKIARRLGIPSTTAHRYIHRAIAALEHRPGDNAAEIAVENARLNTWYARLDADFETGVDIDRTVAAARTAALLSKERRLLLGLDAPRKASVYIEPERPEPRPDMALLEELRRVTQHEDEMADLEANDGLMEP